LLALNKCPGNLPQQSATCGEPEKHPLCLIENLSCREGLICAFHVTSTWVSYSSLIVRSAWRDPASSWPGSGGWRGHEALGKALQCLPLLSLHFVTLFLLDGQDALTLFDQLNSTVRDEPDGQGADRET